MTEGSVEGVANKSYLRTREAHTIPPATKKMAKGNMLLGYARGKVGDLVFQRRQGEQITIPRVRNPRNPQSDAQTIRRLAFASAVKLAQQLERVISNSWQSRRYGQQSVNYFVGKAASVIGGYASRANNGDYYGFAPVVPYSSTLGVCVPIRISEGTLSAGNIRPFHAQGSPMMQFALSPTIPSGTNSITIDNYESVFGVSPDTQITLVLGVVEEMPEFDTPTLVYGVRYRIARLNLVKDIDPATSIYDLSGSELVLNRDVIDPARSNITGVSISGPSGIVSIEADGVSWPASGCASAVIYSRYEDGDWLRSTSMLDAQIGIDSAIHAQEFYGWNDLSEIVSISRKGAESPREDEYLNKEPM